MGYFEFSNRDMKRSVIVEPAWYRAKVISVVDSLSAKGDSTNTTVECEILFNGDTGDTKYAGVPVFLNFNSKAPGFGVGFLQALGVDVVVGQRYDAKASEGMELDMFVGNGEWQGKMKNQVNHEYRKPKPEVKAIG
jgi:hypothetical protein